MKNERTEGNYIVGKLIVDLIEAAKNEGIDKDMSSLMEQCNPIAERLLQLSFDTSSKNLAEVDTHEKIEIPAMKTSLSDSSAERLSTQERLTLVQTLNSLPSSQFDEIVFALNPPNSTMPSNFAPQGSRSSALLSWIESAVGPGILELTVVLESLLAIHLKPNISNSSRESGLLQSLISELKLISAPRYDLRGSTFNGGFAETVEGDQKTGN